MLMPHTWTNQLILRANLSSSSSDGRVARSLLQEIAEAKPTTNGESEAVRVAQRYLSGQMDVAASNQTNGRAIGRESKQRRRNNR